MTLVEHGTEVSLSAYRKGCDKKDRLDIYLEFALGNPIKKGGRTSIRIFIENKVQSIEHDGRFHLQPIYKEFAKRDVYFEEHAVLLRWRH